MRDENNWQNLMWYTGQQENRLYQVFNIIAQDCDSKGDRMAGPLLSILSAMEADLIGDVLNDGDITRFFAEHGQGAAMAALAETLPPARFWNIFKSVSFGYGEYGGADWIIQKLETLTSAQQDFYFKEGIIWDISRGGRSDWVVKKLDERSHESIIDILKSEENISELAQAGQIEWLITKLDPLPLDELVAAFEHNYVAIDIFVKRGFVDWVVNKFDKLPADKFYDIASEALDSICKAGHAEWLLNKFQSHPDQGRRAHWIAEFQKFIDPSPQP